MITRSPRLGACPRRIESENDTPRRRLGPETPAKNRCHSASTLWYGPSNVLHAPFRTSAAPTRGVTSDMITSTAVQVSPPRSRRQSISPEGTMFCRTQRSCRFTMWMRTSRTRTASVNTIRSGYRFVRATDTLMTRHAPLKMTASQILPFRARMNEPTNVAHHTDAPRNRTKTVGSLAASPASTWVIQLFTRIARCVSFSRNVAPAVDANVVVRVIVSIPIAEPARIARGNRIRPLPSAVPTSVPVRAIHQNCSLISTQSACCSESGYIEMTTR